MSKPLNYERNPPDMSIAADVQTWKLARYAELPAGEWHDEPDTAFWVDPATGLACMVNRNGVGALCGYVGVPADHPWSGAGYSSDLCGHSGCYEHTVESSIAIHGGLTYSGGRPGQIEGTDLPGDELTWFGFDCAHSGDLCPGFDLDSPMPSRSVYKNLTYVQNEVASLAYQLAAVTS